MQQQLATAPYPFKIRPWELDALQQLVPILARGLKIIDMRFTGMDIGSRIAQMGNRDPMTYMGMVYSYDLRELMFPGIRPNGTIDWSNPGWNADALRAAKAIDIFLTLGRPLWNEVMAA